MNFLSRLSRLFSSSPKNGMKKYSQQELKQRLSNLQWKVTQQNGTQPPYSNKYYDHYASGVYHCLVCNIPLFASQTKFDSGCGWPAFYDQMKEAKIFKKKDATLGMVRTEVRCSQCDSHLGHIFDDGPKDKTGVRYCINSASINFEKNK